MWQSWQVFSATGSSSIVASEPAYGERKYGVASSWPGRWCAFPEPSSRKTLWQLAQSSGFLSSSPYTRAMCASRLPGSRGVG
jgi:hypothetical protein